MLDSLPDDEQLIRYLLGTMTDEEKIHIEQSYFGDDELFELLLALEQELKQRYALGMLTGNDAVLFEQRYLQQPGLQNELDFARSFVRHVHRLPSPHNWRATVMEWFRSMQKTTQLAFALCLLAALAGGWFAIRFAILTGSLNTLEAERSLLEQKEKTLQQQLADEQLRSRDLTENLEKAKLPIVSFVLSPGSVRSAGDAPKLLLPSSPAQLLLLLDLEGVTQSESYDAVLYDERNAIVMRWEGLQCVRGANGLQVGLVAETKLLKARSYKIDLVGKRKSEKVEYLFAVNGK